MKLVSLKNYVKIILMIVSFLIFIIYIIEELIKHFSDLPELIT